MSETNSVNPPPAAQAALMNRPPMKQLSKDDAAVLGLLDIQVPSVRHVLVWFSKDPMLAMELIRLVQESTHQPNFAELGKNVVIPFVERLFPSLDSLLRVESDSISIMVNVDENVLVEKLIKKIKETPKAMRMMGAQGSSGVQINPGTVMEAVQFFGEYILPLVLLFAKRRAGK